MNKILLFILAFFCLDKLLSAKEVLGKVVLTLLKLFTIGGFMIWWLVDLIMIALGKYKANPLDYLK